MDCWCLNKYNKEQIVHKLFLLLHYYICFPLAGSKCWIMWVTISAKSAFPYKTEALFCLHANFFPIWLSINKYCLCACVFMTESNQNLLGDPILGVDDPVESHHRAVEPALEVQTEHVHLSWACDGQLLCGLHHYILMSVVFKTALHWHLLLAPLAVQHRQPGHSADKRLPNVKPQVLSGFADFHVDTHGPSIGVVFHVWFQVQVIVDWFHVVWQTEIHPVPAGVGGRLAGAPARQRGLGRLCCRGCCRGWCGSGGSVRPGEAHPEAHRHRTQHYHHTDDDYMLSADAVTLLLFLKVHAVNHDLQTHQPHRTKCNFLQGNCSKADLESKLQALSPTVFRLCELIQSLPLRCWGVESRKRRRSKQGKSVRPEENLPHWVGDLFCPQCC